MHEISSLYEIRFDNTEQIEIRKKDQKNFLLSHIWINDQPAKCLKGFNFKKLDPCQWTDAKEVGNDIYIYFPSQEEISVQVYYQNQPLFTPRINPCLTGEGLRIMIERRKQGSFDIKDKSNTPLEEEESLNTHYVEDQDIFIIEDRNDAITKKHIPKWSEETTGGCIAKDFVNLKDQVFLDFDQRAPDYRTVDRGLNLEGKCLNPECLSFKENKLVCIPFEFFRKNEKEQFSEFRISEIACHCTCPACKKPMKSTEIDNCIFWDCVYTIKGMKVGDINEYTEGPIQAPSDKPLSFVKEGNIIKWEYIIITVDRVEEPLSEKSDNQPASSTLCSLF